MANIVRYDPFDLLEGVMKSMLRPGFDAALAQRNGQGATTISIDVVENETISGAATGKDEHAELAASYEFACKDAARAGFIEVGLFDAFARLQRVDVQTATRKGQMKLTLKRPAGRIALVR